jgi:electron transport complex protein RnfG
MWRAVSALFLTGVLLALGLTAVRDWTWPYITTAHDAYLNQQLETLIQAPYTKEILSPQPFLTPGQPAYVNRHFKRTVLPIRASNGYAGVIDMLAAYGDDGQLYGVRIIDHRETPGLGDQIESAAWLSTLVGDDATLLLKKDGGRIDSFTGASVSPRAVLQALRTAAQWVGQNQKGTP